MTKKSDIRATCWSVTINNPIQDDKDNIDSARQKSGWKVYGQLEIGANGTPHYQLCVKTPQCRWSAVTKAFPRAHVDPAIDQKALMSYVQKEDTRVAPIESNEFYPSQTKFWDLCYKIYEQAKNELGFKPLHSEERRLEFLDECVSLLICQGYFVESIGVNPQTRSSAKKFLVEIFMRCKVRRQTDRQTTENNLSEEDITDAHSQITTSSETTRSSP